MAVPFEILELAQKGVVITVATRDAQLMPTVTKGMGLRFAADGSRVTVLVAERWAESTLANCRANGRVAFTVGLPTTYEAAQVKGLFRGARPMEASDEELFQEWARKTKDELYAAGTPRDAVGAFKWRPTHALEIEVTDVFIQTPGPQAGERAR